MIKHAINRLMNKLGYQINKLGNTTNTGLQLSPESVVFQYASTKQALFRTRLKGINVDNIVDVGASNGSWSDVCMQIYPRCSYLLIEANKYHEKSLEAFKSSHENTNFVIAAAGNKDGKCYFDDSNPFGGVAGNTKKDRVVTKLPMVCIDNEVKRQRMKGKYLIKLDTHGFEQSILKGAIDTLKNTEILVIESYMFNLNTPEAITFDKLCLVMDGYGFRVGDFSEPIWRPKDFALWQFDLFFYRKDNRIFKDNNYD